MVWNCRSSYIDQSMARISKIFEKYGLQDILVRAGLFLTMALNSRESSFRFSNIFLSNWRVPLSKPTGKCYLGYNSPSRQYHAQDQISIQHHVWLSRSVEQYPCLYHVCSTVLISYHATSYPWTVSLWLRYSSRQLFPIKLQVDVANEEKTYQL